MNKLKMSKLNLSFESFVDKSEILKTLNLLRIDEVHVTEVTNGKDFLLFGDNEELVIFLNKIKDIYPNNYNKFSEI